MSTTMPCLGGCKRMVVTYCGCGGGCVSFPEDTGYCSHCYPTSKVYREHVTPLVDLIDGLNPSQVGLLSGFIENFNEDHRDMYLQTIERHGVVVDIQQLLRSDIFLDTDIEDPDSVCVEI